MKREQAPSERRKAIIQVVRAPLDSNVIYVANARMQKGEAENNQSLFDKWLLIIWNNRKRAIETVYGKYILNCRYIVHIWRECGLQWN
jgi:hypothetical protein